MAVAFVREGGSQVDKTGGLTTVVATVPAAGHAAGNTVLVHVVTNGSNGITVAVTDSAGNTYTELEFGTPSDGRRSRIFGSVLANALTSGQSITATASSAPASNFGIRAVEFSGLSITEAAPSSFGFSGTSVTNPSVSIASVPSGTLVFAVIGDFGPSGDAFTQDTDTSNGSWTTITRVGTTGGSAASNLTITGAWKIVTGAGAQTYDPTLGTGRAYAAAIVGLAPYVAGQLPLATGGSTSGGSLTLTTKQPLPLTSGGSAGGGSLGLTAPASIAFDAIGGDGAGSQGQLHPLNAEGAEFNTFSWNHVPVGTPKAILVMLDCINRGTGVAAVTYGGVGMTRISQTAELQDPTTLDYNSTEVWFLGSGVPTGTQSVVVIGPDSGGPTNAFGTSMSFTTRNPGAVTAATAQNVGTGSDPSATMTTAAGQDSLAVFGGTFGDTGSPSAGSGYTMKVSRYWSGIYTSDWEVANDTDPGSNVTAGFVHTAYEHTLIGVALKPPAVTVVPATITPASGGSTSGGSLTVRTKQPLTLASGGSTSGGALSFGASVVPASGGSTSGGSLALRARTLLQLASGGGSSGGSLLISVPGAAPVVPASGGGSSGGSLSLTVRPLVEPAEGGGSSGGSLAVSTNQPLDLDSGGSMSGGGLSVGVRAPLTLASGGGSSSGSLSLSVPSPPIDRFFGRDLRATAAAELSIDPTVAGFSPTSQLLAAYPATSADLSGVGTKTWSSPSNVNAQDGVGATVSLGNAVTVTTPVYGTVITPHSAVETRNPQTVVNYNGGSNAWLNPDLAATDDGFFARSVIPSQQSTQFLRALAFGFTTQGSIDGIRAIIKRKALAGGTGTTDTAVYLANHPTIVSVNKQNEGGSPWLNTYTYAQFGSSGDKWGATTLSPSMINSGFFSLYLGVRSNSGDTAHVDHMEMSVWYSWTTSDQVQTGTSSSTSFSTETSHYVKSTNYSFAVPADAVIVGIRVDVTARSTPLSTGAGSFNNDVFDNSVSIVKGGTLQSANRAIGAVLSKGSYGSRSYGGPSDLWGATWTPADINGSTFGAAFSTRGGPAIADVDSIQIVVYYTTPGATANIEGAPLLRFSPDERDAGRILLDSGYGTEMPGGFAGSTLNVSRPETFEPVDYLMAFARIYEYETGETWHEGRVVGVSDDGEQIGFEIEGWAKHMSDNKTARAIFYDREQSAWGSASVQYKLNSIGSGYKSLDGSVVPDPSTGSPAVATGFSESGTQPKLEVVSVYDSDGIPISFADYAWKKNANIVLPDANWSWSLFAGIDDVFSVYDQTANLAAAGPGSGTLTTTGGNRTYLGVGFYYTIPGTWTGYDATVYWTLLGVVGNHGLTLRGSVSAPNTGRGLYASDMIVYTVQTFAPLLEIGDIEVTSNFVVPHAAFKELTTAQDMTEALIVFGNDFYPMDWWIEENRTFRLSSPLNHGETWRARLSEGTTQSGQGPDAQALLNGVMVRYDDGTGTRFTVGPPGSGADSESAVLVDISDTNPANRDGARHWEVYDAGVTTQAGALLIGQVILTGRKAGWRDWRGDIKITIGARDSAGNKQPAAMIRAGDYIVIPDDPNSDWRPRRIVATQYNTAERSVSCSIGAKPDKLEVILAKAGIVLVGKL